MSEIATLWSRIAQIAQGQWGHVTREQLLTLGMAASTITRWVRAGKLVPVHAGVYVLGYRRVEPVARAMAAVLACGDGAVLSHDSALALWGLRRWPEIPEVVAPRCVRRPRIRAHRSTTLTATDVTVQLGVPCVRPARALHDIRRRLTETQRTRLANRARLDRLITLDEFESLEGHRRNPSRSGAEDDLHRWLHHHHFSGWVVNVIVNGHETDVYFVGERVALEYDDPATHLHTFDDDRERDTHNLDHDVQTIRLVRGRLTDHEADRLRRILARRRAAASRSTSG